MKAQMTLLGTEMDYSSNKLEEGFIFRSFHKFVSIINGERLERNGVNLRVGKLRAMVTQLLPVGLGEL